MRPDQTENRPEFQVIEVMRQYAENGQRFPHPGPLFPGAIYPNHGYPPNPGEDRPGLSPFGRLAKGQPLGKKTVLKYNADVNDDQPAAVPILRLEGDDLDATQMIITFAPPLVIPLSEADVDLNEYGIQNMTGEQDNNQVPGDNFPGTADPIAWPPLEAVIEWGIRGASCKMTVDITNGCAVPITASFVNVHAAVTQGSESGEIVGTSALYVLSAFIGPGLNQSLNAKRTIYVGVLANATESAVFAVPTFARRAYLVGCDNTSPPVVTVGYVRFFQSPDGPAGANCVGNFFVSGNQPTGFNVPNAGQYFTVFNQSSRDIKFAVIFELDP